MKELSGKSRELLEISDYSVEIIREILKQNEQILEMNKTLLVVLSAVKVTVPRKDERMI